MAAPVILTRTISAAQDNRVVVSNGLFIRPIPFGTDWTTIRVGLRWHIRDSGANLVGTPRCFFGLCSGNTLVYGDETATHAVGVDYNATTWTRAATNYAVSGTGSLFGAKKVGSTITRTSAISTAWAMGNGAASDSADRTLLYVELTKGSPNFSVRCFFRTTTSSTPPADISEATFLEQLAVSGTPTVTNHSFPAAQNLAVDEGADGDLDHVQFYWDRAMPEMEICDLAIARMA